MTYRMLLVAALMAASPARAQDQLSRADAAAILFTSHFSFTEHGEPVLPVRIMDDQEKIAFTSNGSLKIHPSGPGGPAIDFPGKSRWTASVKDATPAHLGYRAVLSTVPTKNFAAVKEAVKQWHEKGLKTTRLELGTLFSFQGTVFDSRETVICAEPLFDSRTEAQALLQKLGLESSGRVTEILRKRPHGTIILSNHTNKVTISASNAIWFQPANGDLTVKEVEFARGFPWHGRQTRRYGGSFYLAVDRYGKLAIVNVLPAEKMLLGLVPAEIYPDAPAAALQAQAISARNELLSKIGHRHLADPYVICADQHCQVYKGLNAERKRATKAVRETRGKVIFDENGRLADIRYSSTCGGHTEDAHEAWPGVTSPNLKGRFDSAESSGYQRVSEDEVRKFILHPPESYCGRSPKGRKTFRWTRSFTTSELTGKVAKKYKIGTVKDLRILHRGVSGRVNKLRLTGASAEVTVDGELVIRRLFGGLKSSLFLIEKPKQGAVEQTWVFKGGGFGHGVGMCQLGAMEMAKDGKSAEEVLRFYYKGITIERIY
jgi:stage II sporulation protein D